MSKKNSVKKDVDQLAKFESYVLALVRIGKVDQVDQAILTSEHSSQAETNDLQAWLLESKVNSLYEPIADTYQAIADFDQDTAISFLNDQGLTLSDDGKLCLFEESQVETLTSEISATKVFNSVKNSRKKWLAFELAKTGNEDQKVLSGFSGTDLINYFFFHCFFNSEIKNFTLAKAIAFARQYKVDYVSHGHYRYLESVGKQIGLIES